MSNRSERWDSNWDKGGFQTNAVRVSFKIPKKFYEVVREIAINERRKRSIGTTMFLLMEAAYDLLERKEERFLMLYQCKACKARYSADENSASNEELTESGFKFNIV